MGGGGGGVYNNYSPEEYQRKIRESLEKTRDEAYETEVAKFINEILADYNSRDVEAVRDHLDEIKEMIEEDIGGTTNLLFGGSVRKNTYVEGLSDVDILVTIEKSELSDLPPKDILEYVSSKLEENLVNIEDIRVGNLAVTVIFSDGIEIQLLPAIKRGDGFKIPTGRGNDWSKVIRPDKFATRLTEVNQLNSEKVIPAIKLVKGINSQFPENQQLTSYHIESIAIEAFKSYPDSKPKTTKTMLEHFFEKASETVKSPIKDKTGQSINVDEYLGPENSVNRFQISHTLDRVHRRMKNADTVGSVEEWKSILGE